MKPPGTRALLITAEVNVISHDGSALRIVCDGVSIFEECLLIKTHSCNVQFGESFYLKYE